LAATDGKNGDKIEAAILKSFNSIISNSWRVVSYRQRNLISIPQNFTYMKVKRAEKEKPGGVLRNWAQLPIAQQRIAHPGFLL
jgi:hypothetical protein